MPRVFKRAAARRDLVEHYVYLAENAGEPIADRFLACAEASFAALSEHPEMGAALTLRRPELAELRKWRLTLIRHAQSVSNAGGLAQPHQAIPLTAHGHTQARALGATLAGPASAVAVSRFMRAQQTAAPYCQRFNLEPQVDADFDEFSLIDAALIEGLDGALRASTSMDDADFDRTMAGALQVSPVEMTFEDGMRIVEYLTSFVVMFRQAESEQPAPNPENLAKLNEEIEELIQARSALGTAWRRLVNVRQPTLREYHALIAGNTASPQ